MLEMTFDVVGEQVNRHFVIASLGHDDVGVFLRRLNVKQVHGLEHLLVAVDHHLWRASSLNAIPGNHADEAVVGIGINCAHAELPPEVAAMSADLETATGKKPDRSRLAAELVRSLYEMEQALFTQKDAWLAEFSAHCVTIGQDVKLVRGDEVQFAHADGIDGEAALRVTYPDGTAGVIASGEVSVRGMYGYT